MGSGRAVGDCLGCLQPPFLKTLARKMRFMPFTFQALSTLFKKSPAHEVEKKTFSICVAGVSNAGKTSLLQAFEEHRIHHSPWANPEKGRLPYLKKTIGFAMNWLMGGDHVGVQPEPTQGHPVLLSVMTFSPCFGEQYNVELIDSAGTEGFAALLDQGVNLAVNPAVNPAQSTLEKLKQADVIILMLSPENNEIADSIVHLLQNIRTQMVPNKRCPMVQCVFTKADEYGLRWSELTKTPLTLDQFRNIKDSGDNDPRAGIFTHFFGQENAFVEAIEGLSGDSPSGFYFAAAQPVDGDFGKTYCRGRTVQPAYTREGWQRRGVPQIFRDAFDYIEMQRGVRPRTPYWFFFLLLPLIGVLSHDLVVGDTAYREVWKKLDAIVDVESKAKLGKGKYKVLAEFLEKEPTTSVSVRDFKLLMDMQTQKTDPAYFFKSLSRTGRLRRDFWDVRKKDKGVYGGLIFDFEDESRIKARNPASIP